MIEQLQPRGGTENVFRIMVDMMNACYRPSPSGRKRRARDKREERDSRDGRRFEVRSSRFSEIRTQNLELRIAPVALFPPVSPVSLESGIGDCSRSVHEYCGLGSVNLWNPAWTS